MKSRGKALLFAILGIALLLCGCSKLLGRDEGPIEEVLSNGPVYLLLTRTAGAEKDVVVKECGIPDTTGIYGSTVQCSVTLPEAILYYSDLKFRIVTNGACAYVRFFPYYYRAFNVANSTPGWVDGANTDCGKDEIDCFNGPGTLVTGFPEFRGIIFETTEKKYLDFSVPSAFSKGRSSNRWTCNSLPSSQRNTNGTEVTEGLGKDDYIAGTMQDYLVICADKWLQPMYSIQFILDDEDTDPDGTSFGAGAINHFPNWGSGSDPL